MNIDTKEEFYAFFTAKNCREAGDPRRLRPRALERHRAVEEKIKDDLKVTIRCIPDGGAKEPGPLHPHRRTKRAARGLGEVVLMTRE